MLTLVVTLQVELVPHLLLDEEAYLFHPNKAVTDTGDIINGSAQLLRPFEAIRRSCGRMMPTCTGNRGNQTRILNVVATVELITLTEMTAAAAAVVSVPST